MSDEINKIFSKYNEKYARKPTSRLFYYLRPTPQDVLFEEYDGSNLSHSFSGTEIYEWNIDGFTDRQIYNIIHRILMYSTICKVNDNKDKAIAER